jgi:hypothetical protein
VRPVREQLEHDRVIRLLQAKYKRKFEVAINPGNEQTAPVGNGPAPWYPDVVLQTPDKNKKLAGVVEVETAESVNNLEAMSQWATFSRLRVPFHLYVPSACIDSARRLCADLQIPTAEIWAYHAVGDQIRFTLVHRTAEAADSKPAKAAEAAAPRPRAAAAPPARPAAAAAPAAGASAPRPRPARAAAAAAARPAAARPARHAASAAATPARHKPVVKAKAAAPRGAAAKTTRKPAAGSRTQKRK